MIKKTLYHYLIMATTLLSGLLVNQPALSQTVCIPEPIHHLSLQEGAGNTVTDTVTGFQLDGVDTVINWAQDDIKNYPEAWFIKSGKNFNSQGVVQGSLIQDDLDQYTFTFLTRVTDSGSGAIFRSLTDSMHFRFWNGTWDIAGSISADPSYVKYNTWVRVSYVQTATERQIYIDGQLAGQATGTGALRAGNIRLGAYNTDSYFYPGEYSDIKIFNQALTAEEIGLLVAEDGVETEFSSLTTGSDLGGIWKREEHSDQLDSIISSENGVIKHWFNGDSCWGAVSKLIPSDNRSLWFSAEFYYPSILTANHDFGSTAQTIGIYEDFGRSNPIAILVLNHDEVTNVLTLGSITYRNTLNGATTVTLNGSEIDKGVFHQFELNYNHGENGAITFYMNGEELFHVEDNFDLEVRQAMFGFNLGIHPESPGDYFYSKNIYAGVQRLTTQSSLPNPVYHLPLQEGTGTIITDSVTKLQLAGVDTEINWARDDIKNRQNASFVKSGANFGSQGVIQGTLIQENLDEYTFTFLTRITDSGSGAIFRSLTNNMHFRFWYGTWDFAGGLSADPSYVKYNTWVRVSYVQTATERMIYIDKQLAGQSVETGTLYAGDIRLGAYNTDSYFYPGEYMDIRIFDQALTAEQINELVDEDGMEAVFSSLTTGSDLGGLWKREEHGGQYDTIISSENGVIKHWFNGDSCWGAVSKLIPSGNSSLWFSAEFYYPSTLTANHDFGSTAQTIAIYEDFGRSNPIAILYLNHDESTDILTLGRITYRNSTNGMTTVPLDGRVIQKDMFHQFELNYVQGESGTIAFYMAGEELLNVTEDFDLVVQQAMYGFNLGIHPEAPGDFIFSKNIYAGVNRAPTQVVVPEPAYYLPLQEGSGTIVTDSVTGLQLNGVDTAINWVQDEIKGKANKWYVKSGLSSGSQGVIQGTLIQNDLPEYTFSFLTRITDDGSGAIFRSLTDNLHFRFWYGTWDIAGSISAGSAYVQTNIWVRVSYVQSATDQRIYIDEQLAGSGAGSGMMCAGDIRLGAYNISSYHYPGEYTEIKIFDQVLTSEQIAQLVQDDYL